MPDDAPWLKPADPADEFLRAYQVGAAVKEASNRLTQEQNRLEMEAQAKQATLQQTAALETQKIANQKAYQQQEIGIRQLGLENAAKAVAIKGAQAAQRLAAQNKFNSLVASGVSPEKAMFQSGLGTPQIAAEYDKSRSSAASASARAAIDAERLRQSAARGVLQSSETVTDPQNSANKRTTYNRVPLTATAPPLPAGSATPSKVRVKNKDGKTGTIPASQLQDALDAGYTQVQ
jgi:hypothetical protein